MSKVKRLRRRIRRLERRLDAAVDVVVLLHSALKGVMRSMRLKKEAWN